MPNFGEEDLRFLNSNHLGINCLPVVQIQWHGLCNMRRCTPKTFESSDEADCISLERDKNMKPTMQTVENEGRHREARQLPLIDLQYHAGSAGRSGGCCARLTSPSFRNISRAYFDTEANHYFIAEASVFAAIMLTSAVPLINGAHAVLKLIGA
jgi:hypothetical protein